MSNKNTKRISFRFGEKSTSASVQKSLYDAVSKRIGGDELADAWFYNQAREAKLKGVDNVSMYVSEQAYKEILPKSLMRGYVSELKYGRVRTNVKGLKTTLTMPNILMYFMMQVTGCDIEFKRRFNEIANRCISNKTRSEDVRTHIIRTYAN